MSSKSVQGKKVAFTTTLMLILLFCVIRGRILMSENAVNHVIYGSLWTTKTALNDFYTKMVENRIIMTANLHSTVSFGSLDKNFTPKTHFYLLKSFLIYLELCRIQPNRSKSGFGKSKYIFANFNLIVSF